MRDVEYEIDLEEDNEELDFDSDDFEYGEADDDFERDDSELVNFEHLGENNTNNGDNRVKIIAILGVVILIITFLTIMVVNYVRKNKDTLVEEVVTTTKEYTTVDNNITTNVNNTDSISSDSKTGYVEIEPQELEFTDDIEGIFTVTALKFFAKNSGDETFVKSIATGSISGLSGTYGVEVPYHLAVNINIGDSFKLYYKLGNIDGNRVVGISKLQ